MRDLLPLLVHFLATLARLLGPGGMRAVIAETLLIKYQLVILNRSRRRAVPPFDLIRATNGFFAAAGDRRRNRVFSAANRWPDFSVLLCPEGHLSIFSVIQTHPSCRVLLAVDFLGLRRSGSWSQIINQAQDFPE